MYTRKAADRAGGGSMAAKQQTWQFLQDEQADVWWSRVAPPSLPSGPADEF